MMRPFVYWGQSKDRVFIKVDLSEITSVSIATGVTKSRALKHTIAELRVSCIGRLADMVYVGSHYQEVNSTNVNTPPPTLHRDALILWL